MKSPETAKVIAIVEDDPDVARIIEQVLTEFGFATAWCRSGGDLLRRLRSISPDLCIIDLGLPDMDGIEAMQRVRAQTPCGILILTGRAHISDRVMGLELGADDYVLKPFEPRELVARVRSILRRRRPVEAPQPDLGQALEFDGWRLEISRRRLLNPDDQEIELTTGEFDMLAVMVRNAGRVLTREMLMDQTRGRQLEAFDRAIDAQIARLRKKIEPDPAHPTFIRSVRGVGYIFTGGSGTAEARGA